MSSSIYVSAFSFPLVDDLGGSKSSGLQRNSSCFLCRASNDAMESSTDGSLNCGGGLLFPLLSFLLGFGMQVASDTSSGEGSLYGIEYLPLGDAHRP